MPRVGHGTLTTEDVRSLMLATGGQTFTHGSLYEIKSKHLGAGIYRVSLSPWKLS